MKGEERKKRKKVKEIHINHNVWKKYHKGFMKHIILRKKTYISSKEMNDRKDSIKEKIGVIGKINMNQLTEKDLKVQKRTISLLLTRKKKRKKHNFKRFNEGKKYKVLHLTDNKKKNNYLSLKEMNNYRKGLKKRWKKKLWRDQWEPIDQKKIWRYRKGQPLTQKKKKKACKKKEGKNYYIWQIMRSKTLT